MPAQRFDAPEKPCFQFANRKNYRYGKRRDRTRARQQRRGKLSRAIVIGIQEHDHGGSAHSVPHGLDYRPFQFTRLYDFVAFHPEWPGGVRAHASQENRQGLGFGESLDDADD